MHLNSTSAKSIVLISAIYFFCILLMLPLRNVGFFDDFAYIRTVERLYNTGILQISDWSAVSFIFQAYWGLLFAKIFGFSIQSLHLSNIVLSYIGLIFFYLLLKRFEIKNAHAVFFTLFILGLPLIFNYIFTFMSDTFYISLILIALYFYVVGFQTKKLLWFFTASLVTGAAYLTRQIAIVLPLSVLVIFAYAFLTQRKFYPKLLAASLAPFGLILGLYYSWLSEVGTTAAYIAWVIDPVTRGLLPFVFPKDPGHAGITHRLFTEALIQRGVPYFIFTTGLMLPVILVFKTGILNIFKYVLSSKKTLFGVLTVLLFCFYIDASLNSKFSKDLPDVIDHYEKVLFNWRTLWPILVKISIPIWVVIISYILIKTHSLIFVVKKRPNLNYIKLSILLILAISIYFTCQVMVATYPDKYNHVHMASKLEFIRDSKFLSSIYNIKKIARDFSPQILLDTLKGTWLVYLLYFLPPFLLVYTIATRKFKTIEFNKAAYLLPVLVFLLQVVFILIFASFYWQEYLIQLIPFVILGLAFIFNRFSLSIPLASIVLLVMLFMSVETSRLRYQDHGARWELAEKIVQQGVNPYNISEPAWAWRPYWFFESTFAEKLAKHNGDKLKAGKDNIGGWLKDTVEGEQYDFRDIQSDSDIPDNTIFVSDPYFIFTKEGIVYKRVAVYKSGVYKK